MLSDQAYLPMNNNPQEEIDLVSLLARFVKLLRRNAALILICVGITLGLSLWIGLTRHKVYESRMMIYSSILTESYCDQLARNLQSLIRDRNLKLIGERLGLSQDQAALLRDVEIEGGLEGTVDEADKLFLVVTVRVFSNTILPDLQDGIVRYIGQNDFAKVRTEEKRRFYNELIAKVDEEIQKLEGVKQKISDGAYRSSNGVVMMNPSDPYTATVALFRDKLAYEELLRLVNSVQVVEGFSALNRHVSPKLSLLLPAGLLAGLILAFLILGLRYVISLSRQDE